MRALQHATRSHDNAEFLNPLEGKHIPAVQ